MNVIVAGEESGVGRDAFARLGHNAWSCDLKPTRRPGQHWQGSWREIEWASFDLAITHPECTHLAVSGAQWFAQKRADGRQQAAIEEFMYLARAPVYASCTENPVCIMSTVWRKPDQIIQPWQFGRWETKALCYWLKNLLPPSAAVPDARRSARGAGPSARREARGAGSQDGLRPEPGGNAFRIIPRGCGCDGSAMGWRSCRSEGCGMNEDRIKELVAAAKLALADDGGLRYEGEDDDCGSHACCGVVSYKDHAEDCWVPRLAAAVSAMEAAA